MKNAKVLVKVLLVILLLLQVGNLSAQNSSCQANPPKVLKSIAYAAPKGHSLTMDIYVPQTGKSKYPVLVIYHGGGWLVNSNAIMNSMSNYVATKGEYIVCNVNYRLLVDEGNTVAMNEIVEDVLGALAWIKENISSYGGDPDKVAVTGDSAGGHLAAMAVLMGDNLSSDGFISPKFGFRPSYIPKNETPESMNKKHYLKVQAAVLSYGAFDIYAACKGGFEKESNFFWSFSKAKARGIFGVNINVDNNPEYYKAVSPVYNVPKASEKQLPPQLLTVGSKDSTIPPEQVVRYQKILKDAGHIAEYWEYEGRPHAFLDSGSNEYLGISFEKDAPKALDVMIDFLDKYLKR